MTKNGSDKLPGFRLGLLMFIFGMLGVVSLVLTVFPQLLYAIDLPVPLWLAFLAGIAQTAILLSFFVLLGVLLAPKVGLNAPAFEAAVTNRSVGEALLPQLFPGFIAGLLGGIGLFAIGGYDSPMAIAGVDPQFTVPLFARVLYGGITEELLLRWGLMTLLVWVAWRFVQSRKGAPRVIFIWSAIILSALLFGAGHLPALAMQVEGLTVDLVLFVIGANSVFGVLFGYLFWKYGLESAMIAHALAHAVSYIIGFIAA